MMGVKQLTATRGASRPRGRPRNSPEDRMERVYAHLRIRTYDQLCCIALQRRISVSALLRHVVEEYMGSVETVAR